MITIIGENNYKMRDNRKMPSLLKNPQQHEALINSESYRD